MKLLFTTLFLLITTCIHAQDVLHVLVNNKEVAHFTSNNEPVTISLKKSAAAKSKNIFIQLTAKAESPYKYSVEIMDSKESKSTVINLTEKNYAKQSISSLLKDYGFFKGRIIKIYLMQNPANDKMMMPSKRIYLGALTIR